MRRSSRNRPFTPPHKWCFSSLISPVREIKICSCPWPIRGIPLGGLSESRSGPQHRNRAMKRQSATFRALTHLHADLSNGPGGIVADRDELRVQVGAQDRHELS